MEHRSRRIGPVATAMVALTAACGLAVACGDDSAGEPGGSTSPDAGDGGTDDAKNPDDGGGATDAPLTGSSVRVEITLRGAPRAGIAVVFHDASGAPIESATTDGMGRATSNPAGAVPAMATALLGKGTRSPFLITWTGVEAGDDLRASDWQSPADLGTYSVALPSLLPDAGSYSAYASNCGGFGQSSPLSVFVRSSCVGMLNAPLIVAETNGGTRIGFTYKKDVPPPAGTTSISGFPDWMTPDTVTLAVQNKPDAGGVYPSFTEIVNGIGTPNVSYLGVGDTPLAYKIAPGYADAFQAGVNSLPGGAGTSKRRHMLSRFPTSTTSVTFDFAQALPELVSTSIDTTDPSRPVVSWTSTSSLGMTDGGVLFTTTYLPQATTLTWRIVVAPGSTSGSMKAPSLPPALAAGYVPESSGGSGVWAQPGAVFAEADTIAGYSAFRAGCADTVMPFVFRALFDVPVAILPSNGSLRTTELQ